METNGPENNREIMGNLSEDQINDRNSGTSDLSRQLETNDNRKEISRRELVKQGGLALSVLALPFPLTSFLNFNEMTENKNFDVIIIGGSYSLFNP